jgi:hypothetical protein
MLYGSAWSWQAAEKQLASAAGDGCGDEESA